MKYIKKFESFLAEGADSPSPITKPAPPITKPGTRPQKPSPIRRDKPEVSPAPKAKLKKATAEEVAETFISELNKRGESVKNYIK